MHEVRFSVVLIFALCSWTSADAVTIPTVPIRDPGNSADMRYVDSYHPNGVGTVAHPFNIGKTEVTNTQYVEFLNSVAASDPYGLYTPMIDDLGNLLGGIVRSGMSGTYTYAVQTPALNGTYKYDDKPVVFVSSGDAMRFANWLQNGQPTGSENATTTEDGAYTLNGAITDSALAAVARNAGARWWLPNEDEWYKAAYYDPPRGSYYDYATATDSVPNDNPPSADTGNSVNYWGSSSTTDDLSYPLTNAGAYTLSASPYGTFDQNGNVWEWNETLLAGPFRGLRGGDFVNQASYMAASFWFLDDPTAQRNAYGFRVASASIPEPSAMYLAMLAALGAWCQRRHRLLNGRFDGGARL